MPTAKSKFEVDAAGLAKILERRGKAFAIFELIQNCWDTNAKTVMVKLEPIEGRPVAQLVVTDDDPDGFDDLTHAFTLFAESRKRKDPTKRGWINLGEKLVLALCSQATLSTTKGTVEFTRDSRKEYPRRKTDQGTVFSAEIKMTRAEIAECTQAIMTLLPHPSVNTYFNSTLIPSRKVAAGFRASLPTHVADDDGIMRRRMRETEVLVFERGHNEVGMLYEMGIPVVETGDEWHVSVNQKVPLNTDRDNVPPSYLRTIRAHVLNEMAKRGPLAPAVATQNWVNDALGDQAIESESVNAVLDSRFGRKHFTFDPSDPEANNRLISQDYTPIYAGSLPKEAWSKVRDFNASAPAGQLSPTPKQQFSADGRPLHEITHEKQTDFERAFVRLATEAGYHVMGMKIEIMLVSDPAITSGACYGGRRMIANKFRLGKVFFEPDRALRSRWEGLQSKLPAWVDLITHEFAHEFESNHLSEKYHVACTKIAGDFFRWAMTDYAVIKDILIRE